MAGRPLRQKKKKLFDFKNKKQGVVAPRFYCKACFCGGTFNEIFIKVGVTLAGGSAKRGDGGERGRADGGGDQLSTVKRTDDLFARSREHPLSLLAQVSLHCTSVFTTQSRFLLFVIDFLFKQSKCVQAHGPGRAMKPEN